MLYLPPPAVGANDAERGAVNGGRSDQGNVTLDGIDDNDQVNGYAFTGVLRPDPGLNRRVPRSNREYQCRSGRSSGAQVSMVTKWGTNKFHGAAYEYHRQRTRSPTIGSSSRAQLTRRAQHPRQAYPQHHLAPTSEVRSSRQAFLLCRITRAADGRESASVIRTVPTARYQAGQLTVSQDVRRQHPGHHRDADIARLDAGCTGLQHRRLSQSSWAQSQCLALFNSFPAANGTTPGDGGYN